MKGDSNFELVVRFYLEEISVSERCAETEDEITLWVFGYWLHDGPVDDDEMFGCGFNVPSFPRVARIEQERRSFETDPIAAPASLPRQLHLVLLAQQPLFHAQKPVRIKSQRFNRKNEKKKDDEKLKTFNYTFNKH